MTTNLPPVPVESLLAHRPWVRALARRLVADPATVDDVEQATWVAALESPPSDAAKARPWLARVVRNAVHAVGRREGRRRRHERAGARSAVAPSTAQVVADAEQHRRVVLAVTSLDEPYRTTVLLRFYEGLPPREVARRMDVPVETVRTRTRRALERLREHFDAESGGDRSVWTGALAPLVAGGEPGGNPTMTRTQLTLTLAAAAALLGALLVIWHDEGDAADGADPPAVEEASDAPGGRSDSRRSASARRAPPLLPGPDGDDEPPAPGEHVEDEEITDEPPRVVDGHPADDVIEARIRAQLALPESMRGADVGAGALTLRFRLEQESPRTGDRIDFVAIFTNEGSGPTRLHVPDGEGLRPWPEIRLAADDGRVFRPVATPYQSMWTPGVLGRLVTLAPGESLEVTSWLGGFVEEPRDDATAAGDWRHQGVLPPGAYTIRCRHQVQDATVPVALRNFREESWKAEGLWQGETRAEDRVIRIAPPPRPMVTIEAPEVLVPGKPFVARLTYRNGGTETASIDATFAVGLHSKGSRGWTSSRGALSAPDAPFDVTLPPAEWPTFELPPGGERTFEIDVRRLGFGLARGGPGASPHVPESEATADLFEVCPGGSVGLSFRPARDDLLHTPMIHRRVRRDGEALPGGLALEARSDGDGTNGVPRITVAVLKRGDAPVFLPTRLAHPADVFFSIRREGDAQPPRVGSVAPDGRSAPPPLPLEFPDGRAVLPHESFWHLDALKRGAPLARGDFETLAPGTSRERTFDVGASLDRPLPAGTYVLRAHWRNVVDGHRLFDGRRAAAVGYLESAEIRFEVK